MAKILLVEDDKLLAQSVIQWLEREGYVVDSAGDAELGKEYALHHPFDLLILDWELPKGSGIDILQAFRQSGQQTCVLILTGRDSTADKRTGLDAGADDYLTKPFDYVELSARIRALLRRTTNVYKPILEGLGIQLDPAKNTVHKDGIQIRLTPKEFALLELLMKQPGEPITAENICARLWSTDKDISPESIRTYMTRLRQKINAEGHEIIHTVWGRGYKFGD